METWESAIEVGHVEDTFEGKRSPRWVITWSGCSVVAGSPGIPGVPGVPWIAGEP